ncbi:unnamed protein product, partial [Dovyalis caffra]
MNSEINFINYLFWAVGTAPTNAFLRHMKPPPLPNLEAVATAPTNPNRGAVSIAFTKSITCG